MWHPMTWRAISTGPIARHGMQRMVNPRFLNYVAPYDVASNICQALPHWKLGWYLR